MWRRSRARYPLRGGGGQRRQATGHRPPARRACRAASDARAATETVASMPADSSAKRPQVDAPESDSAQKRRKAAAGLDVLELPMVEPPPASAGGGKRPGGTDALDGTFSLGDLLTATKLNPNTTEKPQQQEPTPRSEPWANGDLGQVRCSHTQPGPAAAVGRCRPGARYDWSVLFVPPRLTHPSHTAASAVEHRRGREAPFACRAAGD